MPTSSLEIWTHEVAGQLAADHDVHVFGSRGPRSLRGESFEHGGLRYHMLPTSLDVLSRKLLAHLPIRRSPTSPMVASGWHYAAWANRAAFALKRIQPDVIHIHNQFSFVRPMRRLNRRARIVLHMQSEWLSQLDRSEVDPAIRETDAVIACSQHVLGRVRDRFGPSLRFGAVVSNGVDLDLFQPPSEQARALRSTRNVVFVGRVSPEKGCHTLVEAFSRLAAADPTLTLQLVGPVGALPADYIVKVSPEPFVRDLDRFYQGANLNYGEQILAGIPEAQRERIRMTGPLPREDVAAAIAGADVLANPSLSETFGMALAEGMASGVPVVATRVGGMPEVVREGITGLLVPPEDPASLAAALQKLLYDQSLSRQFGTAGRRLAEDSYSWSTIAGDISRLYASLMEATPDRETAQADAVITEASRSGVPR